jgi:hypothetical protein
LLFISLAFVHKEEKIEQEKEKAQSEKRIFSKVFFFPSLSFNGFSLPPQRLFCVEGLKHVLERCKHVLKES